ncbi:membrane protein [Kitasatospora xanthocidica]|nr:membrane protein [Kitasatospora xanthocidica]
MRARLVAASAAVVTVVAGLGVRAVAGGDVAKYAGDALYTVLVYALVVLVVPRVRPARAAVTAAALSWAVELFQLTGLPDAWGRRSTLARLVLGSTFNPPDLFWYLVGAVFGALVHRVLRGVRAAAPGMV